MSGEWLRADWPAPGNIIAGTTLRTGDIAAVGLPGKPCWLNQLHGTCVVEAGNFDVPPGADAAIGSKPGDVCVVKTADCLPVLLCSSDGSEVGIAHAGWRGLAAGIIENTVAEMTHDPDGLLAWLGPAISQPLFEVGDEVREAFLEHDRAAAACFVSNIRERWQADLYALARLRLRAAGVTQVYGGGLCTYSDDRRFFSYRRDGATGRMVSFVARLS